MSDVVDRIAARIGVRQNRPRFARRHREVGHDDERAHAGRRIEARIDDIFALGNGDDDAADDRGHAVVGMTFEHRDHACEFFDRRNRIAQCRRDCKPECRAGRAAAETAAERHGIVDGDGERRRRLTDAGIQRAHRAQHLIAQSAVRRRFGPGERPRWLRAGLEYVDVGTNAQIEREPDRIESRSEVRARCRNANREPLHAGALRRSMTSAGSTPRRILLANAAVLS